MKIQLIALVMKERDSAIYYIDLEYVKYQSTFK